jgi:hypothetical protein
MATKRADAPIGVLLPTGIADSPFAGAVQSLGNELRAAAAKACGLPVEGFTLEIMLAPGEKAATKRPLLLHLRSRAARGSGRSRGASPAAYRPQRPFSHKRARRN